MRETIIRTLILAIGISLLAVPALAQDHVGNWHCKLNGDIPLGTLTIEADGSYEMVVAKNSTWERKEGDRGNGTGLLNVNGNMLTPVSGPLSEVYEVVGGYSDVNQRYIGWGSDSAALGLFACWPANEVN